MKILDYQKFLETNLTLPELSKIRKGDARGNVLVKKLKNKDPLTTLNNQQHTIDKMEDENGNWVEVEDAIDKITDQGGNYDTTKGNKYFKRRGKYTPVLKDEDGDEFSLNQFKKTRDFGSSGAGVSTRPSESIQAIFMAIKQGYPDEKLTKENLMSFYKRFLEIGNYKLLGLSEKITIDESLIVEFLKDKDWVSTFCSIPNKLWEDDHYIDTGELYIIYQIGCERPSPITCLTNKYKELSEKEGFKDINFAKWCPGDIYMVSYIENDAIMGAIDEIESIGDLTELCDHLFDDKTMIPVSLKKIQANKRLTLITNKEKDKNLPTFRINHFIIGNDMKGIGSKIETDAFWRYRDRKLKPDTRKRKFNLDSSNTGTKQNIDGEVEGSTSRHGKISFNAMVRILNLFKNVAPNMTQPQSSSELSKLDLNQLERLVQKLINEIKSHPRFVEARPIKGTEIAGSEGRLISRIQSLQIVKALIQIKEASEVEANIAMTKIMRYALSIQTDKFDTPRYLRLL